MQTPENTFGGVSQIKAFFKSRICSGSPAHRRTELAGSQAEDSGTRGRGLPAGAGVEAVLDLVAGRAGGGGGVVLGQHRLRPELQSAELQVQTRDVGRAGHLYRQRRDLPERNRRIRRHE